MVANQEVPVEISIMLMIVIFSALIIFFIFYHQRKNESLQIKVAVAMLGQTLTLMIVVVVSMVIFEGSPIVVGSVIPPSTLGLIIIIYKINNLISKQNSTINIHFPPLQ